MISEAAAAGVYEGHPEIAFAILNQASPLGSKKKRVAGRLVGLNLLTPYFGDLSPTWNRGVGLERCLTRSWMRLRCSTLRIGSHWTHPTPDGSIASSAGYGWEDRADSRVAS
jgi:hypothetical protein